MTETNIRSAYLAVILGWANRQPPVPYIYDGKDPDNDTVTTDSQGNRLILPPGLDCSGCACKAMEEIQIASTGFALAHNTTWLWQNLSPIDESEALGGDLVLYGDDADHIDHVMILVGDGRVIGSSGAGRGCITVAQAQAAGACVHFRDSPRYRADLLGFRALPVDGLAT